MDARVWDSEERDLEPELAAFGRYIKERLPILEPSPQFQRSLEDRLMLAAEQRLSYSPVKNPSDLLIKGAVAGAAALSVLGGGIAFVLWRTHAGQRFPSVFSHLANKAS